MPTNRSELENHKKELYRQLLFHTLGWLGIGAMVTAGLIFKEKMTVEAKYFFLGGVTVALLGTLSCLPKIITSIGKIGKEISTKEKGDYCQDIKTLQEPVTSDLAEAAQKLPISALILRQLPTDDMENNQPVIDNLLIEFDQSKEIPINLINLIRKRGYALGRVLRAINPSDSRSLGALDGLTQCFPRATSERGISLLPPEKEVVLKLLSWLPMVPPDQHKNSDRMVVYFKKLAKIYWKILNSYLDQIDVSRATAASTIQADNLTAAVRAERVTEGLVSIPMIDHQVVQELRKREKSRSLLSVEDATMMAKLLTAVWFRYLPDAQAAATPLISQLKVYINSIKKGLPEKETDQLELLKEILGLPGKWYQLMKIKEDGVDPKLIELIKRLEKAAAGVDDLSGWLTGRDRSPRGIIQHYDKYGEISMGIHIREQNFSDSCLVIDSPDNLLFKAEKVAICGALMFPGIKTLEIKLKGFQPIRVPLAEFYLERIIKDRTNYLRQMLKIESLGIVAYQS